MSNNTAEKKKLQGVFALWKCNSYNGKTYFSGKTEDGMNLIGFYNKDKKNLKEPDLRVYIKDDEGNLSAEEFVSLWVNATKRGKKLLSGRLDGKKLIGFINAGADEKHPYISVYFADEDEKQEEKKVSNKKDSKKTPKKEAPKKDPEFVDTDEEELPF